jgi:hypothetical protein
MGIKRFALHLAHIVAGFAVILMPAFAMADQTDQPAPAVKPPAIEPVQQSTKPAKRTGPAQPSPWTIQEALPDRSLALRPYEPPASPGLGRLPLRSGQGSFGFETETRVKGNEMPDGRVIPGLEPNGRKTSQSFVGLSLSVPTIDNGSSAAGPSAPEPSATPW